MRRPTWLPLLLVPLLAACLETDLTLQPDGKVTGTLSWTATGKLPEAGARALITGDGVTVKKLDMKEVEVAADPKGGAAGKAQRVTADLEATSVKTLAAIPLLKTLQVSADVGAPQGGKRKLTIRAAKSERLGKIPTTDNVVRLHLPGAVSQTSGKASGNEVTWTVPASEFTSKPSIELSAVYAEATAATPKKP